MVDKRSFILLLYLFVLEATLFKLAAPSSCALGTYKSDYLSGGCAKCPDELSNCGEQEVEDAARCSEVCGKLRLTTTRVPELSRTLPSLQPSPSPTRSRPTLPFSATLPKTYSTSTLSTSGVPTKPTVINGELSGGSNRDILVLGLLFSFGALVVLLIIIILVLCWRQRQNYLAVSTSSRSCSDENVKKDEEYELDGISMSSFHVLNEMHETKL